MTLLFWIVFLGVIVLTFYALSISGDSEAKAKIKKGQAKDSLEVKEAEIAAKQQKISELQEQINALKSELEKAKVDSNHVKEEVELAKKKEADLKQELVKKEQWVKTSDEALQKIKAQNQETEKKFGVKEKALEQEFAKNVESTRKINDLTTKMQWLEKDNKDKVTEIETLKRQVQDRINEAQALAKTVEEMKDEKEHSEWVPKREFNKLNEEYDELEEESEKKEQRIKVLSDEIIQLKNQLKSKEESVRQQPEQPVDKEPPSGEQKGRGQIEKEVP